MDPHALSRRCVIHVDIDSFFLAVHRRLDPSLDDAKPLVLWQYLPALRCLCISPSSSMDA